MGDTSLQPCPPADLPQSDAAAGSFQTSSAAAVVHSHVSASYPSAFSPAHLGQQRSSPQYAFSSQLDVAQPHHGLTQTESFDMSSMANALPQPGFRPGPYNQGQPRYNTIAIPSPVPQFGSQNSMGPLASQQYYALPQHAHMAHYYATPLSPQPLGSNGPLRADLNYYPSAVAVNQQPHSAAQYYYPQAPHYPGQAAQTPAQLMLGQYPVTNPQSLDPRQPQLQPGAQIVSSTPLAEPGNNAADGRHNIVRGPPRKPRQSGHAIWIGNLPPQTDLMSLVHHVCKEAEGLESLFLISKSNCAFANFKDEQTSVAAQRKLHDSKFLTVRLVSRLRKSTVEGPAGITAPTGPAASTPQGDITAEPASAGKTENNQHNGTAAAATVSKDETRIISSPVDSASTQKDRFFILKSLTVEDIELSARTSIWATQSHNEETLNNAFRNSDNVYLIFSANKSGEYFGYARMVSPINEDPEAAIEFAPKAQAASDVELPKAIPTEATDYAPRGRIIDDSARGTIFWEAERDDQVSGNGNPDEEGSGGGSVSGDTGSVKSSHDGASGGEPKAWGKPFRLEWLSTARLPFYRTRGLRNPWNSNREVKIARDGTELEPSVGRRLIGLFNRAQSPALGLVPGFVAGGVRGPIPVAAGYSPVGPLFQPQ